MSKLPLTLLQLSLTLLVVGCNVLAPPVPTPTAESRALAATTLAYHTPRAVTPLPAPAPTPKPNPDKCARCNGTGWITHGDGHKTQCPDCSSSLLPPTPLPPVLVPARIPTEEPPLFAPDIESCWEADNDILVCFTSTDAELKTLTKTLTTLRNQPNPPDITFFHLSTTEDWGGQPAYQFWGVPKSAPSFHVFDSNRKLRGSLSPSRLLLSSPEKLGAALTFRDRKPQTIPTTP